MNGFNLNKTLIATLLLTYFFWGSSLTYGQQTSEQFIPIGMSPGISNKLSYIGNITVVDKATNTFLMQSDNGARTITISLSTRIWLDRSKIKKSNIEAGFDNLEVGLTVEVMHSREDKNIADWVKIESL